MGKKKNFGISSGFFISRPFKYNLRWGSEGTDSVRVVHPPHRNISGQYLRGFQWDISASKKKIQTPSVVPSGAGSSGPQALKSITPSREAATTSGTANGFSPDRLPLELRFGCGELS
jgi:hypothetical protein